MTRRALRTVSITGVLAVLIVASLVTAGTALAATGTASGSQRVAAPAGGCTLGWPFATKAAAQFHRVDQGWDLQTRAGQPVRAVAAGVLGVAHDPGGFGDGYLFEVLDKRPPTAPSDTIYYGHATLSPLAAGTHVIAGETIARTNTANRQNGSDGPAGWLEIGFARHRSGTPVQRGSGATHAGADMKRILLNARVACATLVRGDWDGSGVVHYGTVRVTNRGLVWHECLAYHCSRRRIVRFGLSTDHPVVGDWDGSGIDHPGAVRISKVNVVRLECLDATCSQSRTVRLRTAAKVPAT
jgi:hypothetical protein